MAITRLGNVKTSGHLYSSIRYILNPEKTEHGLWVGGNCGVAAKEIYSTMIDTKKFFGKEWGRQGYHFVISCAPGESDVETMYQVAKAFCQEYLGDAYEYCFAVHTDQEHMHAHIVFNSVSRLDGYKYRYVDGDWEKMIQPVTDRICQEYGLPELIYEKGERIGKSYAEHLAEKEGHPIGKDIIRADIDAAISRSDNMQDFFAHMKHMGYRVRQGESSKYGRYLAYTMPGTEENRARRDYRLGPGYRLSDIAERLQRPEKEPLKTQLYRPHLEVIRGVSIYQRRMVFRVRQAAEYQAFDLLEREQARVRRDLLKINQLEQECNYLLKHDLRDLEDVKAKLKDVNQQILIEKNKMYSYGRISAALSEEQRLIVAEYQKKQDQLQHDQYLTDEAFESLADEVEEMERAYGELLVSPNAQGMEAKQKLSLLKEEHTILLRLSREYEETMTIREAAKRKESLEMETDKELEEEKVKK